MLRGLLGDPVLAAVLAPEFLTVLEDRRRVVHDVARRRVAASEEQTRFTS